MISEFSFNAKFDSFNDLLFLLEQIIFVVIREVLEQKTMEIGIYFIILKKIPIITAKENAFFIY